MSMDKTGHWILDSIVSMDNTNTKTFIYKCSECGFYTTSNRIDVCRHCGAKMNNQEKGKNRTEGRVMTNEEAIDYLLDPIGKREQHDEAVALAVSALKKQIPKKPNYYKEEDISVKGLFFVHTHCPVCEKEIVMDDMYCACCGQKIDWG